MKKKRHNQKRFDLWLDRQLVELVQEKFYRETITASIIAALRHATKKDENA